MLRTASFNRCDSGPGTGSEQVLKEREAARRAQILDAVTKVVDDFGVDGVTMRRVAERAEVSVGMVTYYYASKRELIFDALKEANDRRSRERRAIGGADASPRRMAAYFDVAFSDEPGIQDWPFTLMTWAQATRDAGLQRYLVEHFVEGRESMAAHIQVGIDAGLVRSDLDPHALAELFIAVRDGLGVEIALGADDVNVSRARELAAVFLKLIRPSYGHTPSK
jgi:TetR/AcrR family transcriptional regulator, transcriptional repressor of bet genes